MDYEIVIGLEVHVQLLTETKIFCGCRNYFSHEPNTNVCPVCLGHPGTLPVFNRNALVLGIRGALAINCEIPPKTKFDRKHYYYPDLPKNYQISQYDMPISENGYLDIVVDGVEKRIGITRAHLEEDAGKLVHADGSSHVDLNRTGTPLLEIVSEPDIRSPQEAKAYLELLKLTLLYTGVSDCNMEEGSLRCDANISLRPKGQKEFGVKNEIKNMNSFRAVEHALTLVAKELEYALDSNEEIKQVTWGYSIDRQKIFKMRTKEHANDYRYFPDPDLPAIYVSREEVENAHASLPEMPRTKEKRFIAEYGLSYYDAGVLIQNRELSDYFEETAKKSEASKESANWVINDISRELSERKIDCISNFPVNSDSLADLIALLGERKINMPTARKIFTQILDGDNASPTEIVERDALAQVSDTGEIGDALEKIISDNPEQVAQIEGGKHQTAMWFVGQVMQVMRGKADPQTVTSMIAQRFDIAPELLQKKKKK